MLTLGLCFASCLAGFMLCALLGANHAFDRFDVFFDGWRAGFRACREKMAQDAQVVAQLNQGSAKTRRLMDDLGIEPLTLYVNGSDN